MNRHSLQALFIHLFWFALNSVWLNRAFEWWFCCFGGRKYRYLRLSKVWCGIELGLVMVIIFLVMGGRLAGDDMAWKDSKKVNCGISALKVRRGCWGYDLIFVMMSDEIFLIYAEIYWICRLYRFWTLLWRTSSLNEDIVWYRRGSGKGCKILLVTSKFGVIWGKFSRILVH